MSIKPLKRNTSWNRGRETRPRTGKNKELAGRQRYHIVLFSLVLHQEDKGTILPYFQQCYIGRQRYHIALFLQVLCWDTQVSQCSVYTRVTLGDKGINLPCFHQCYIGRQRYQITLLSLVLHWEKVPHCPVFTSVILEAPVVQWLVLLWEPQLPSGKHA